MSRLHKSIEQQQQGGDGTDSEDKVILFLFPV